MAHTYYRTKGIVLAKTNRGEADQLFTVFTEDFGKIEVLGRAIRKIKSKLRKGVDLFYYSEIEFIQGKNYKTLTDAILIERFGKNPEEFEIIRQITESLNSLTLNSLTNKEHCDNKIWHLLLTSLYICTRSDLVQTLLGLTSSFFIWNLFNILGYNPQLYNCAFCHQKLLPNKLFFSSEHGGVICQQCKGQDEARQEILIDTIKVLRLCIKEPIQKVINIKIRDDVLDNLQDISKNYLKHLTENLGKV